MILLFLVCYLFDFEFVGIKDMHNIYYLGLSSEHRCPLGYLLPFPIEKLPNLTLLKNRPRSLQGHQLITPGSSVEQTIMGRSPKFHMPSVVEICPPVPEKKTFEEFLPYMGVAAILVM